MRAAKSDLRRRMLARRDLVSPDEARAAACAGAERGITLVREKLAPGAVVAAYWPIRREFGTRPLMEQLTAAGFPTALPVTHVVGQPLEFRLWSVGDDLGQGMLGNAEPAASTTPVSPAALFIPLVAFDAQGVRLGYGAGFYDATLAALRPRGVLAVGFAYDLQEVEAVPAEAHDQRIDYVITETRILATGAG